MAKTLKQMLEVYKPKAADEQKFADKHVAVKHDDRNGNKDDVFQGTNVKPVDRKKERHGYTAGEDEKVYEEVEQVDEKLTPSQGAGEYVKDFKKSNAPQFKGKSKEKRRVMAIAAYLGAKNKTNEEVEQVKLKEDTELDSRLLGLYANLDEENKASMLKMIDEGKTADLIEFVEMMESNNG